MRKSFFNPVPNAPQPVRGEIIPLRSEDPPLSNLGIGISIVFIGALGTLGFYLFDGGSSPFLALMVVQILAGVLLIWWSCYELKQRPTLVVGEDCVQYLRGKRVFWELPYGNIAEIKLFTHGVIPIQSLGINLISPELFDRTWPSRARARRWNQGLIGFDFHIPTVRTPEPPDRLLDVFLISYHRFKANRSQNPPTD